MLFSADQKVHVDKQGALKESLQTVDGTFQSERKRTLGLCDIQLNGFAGIDFNNPNLNYEERIRRWLEAESLLSELGYNKNTQSTNMIKFKKFYQSTINFYQCNKKQYEFAV